MYIGKPVKRIEDLNLIRGRGQYVDDIVLPNMKYVAFVRSERPHALVKVRSDVPFYGGEVINPGLDFPIVSKETLTWVSLWARWSVGTSMKYTICWRRSR